MIIETNNRRLKLRHTLVAVLLTGTAIGGFTFAADSWAQGAPSTTQTTQAPSGAIQPAATPHLIPDFADLVTQVKPAVVSITVKMKPQQVADDEDVPMLPGMRRGGRNAQHVMEARGSGFIVAADGTVVTNNHVVKDAQSVSVTLDDGTQLPAKIVGRDPRTDLAVLKISAGHPLPFIKLGESDDVRPGQWVVAMGNPFGLGGSVTAGIVSARGRDIGSGPYDSFIQVDAPINQGNSGGPLFTQDGKVVGVNTAILSPSGGSVGIGFAIPSDTVRTVIAQLEKDGHVTRGYLGVQAQALSPEMSKAMRLPADAGALVASVEPSSPAAKAGLQPGDVIKSVDGHAVSNPRDLAVDIAGVQPGTMAALQVVRDGNQKQVSVNLATMPSDTASADGSDAGASHGIGLALAPLSPDVRDQLNLSSKVHGAVIATVQPGSAAEQAGLQPGDVVVGIGSKSVANPQEAADAIASATSNGGAAALRVMRNGNTMFVAVAPDTSNQG